MTRRAYLYFALTFVLGTVLGGVGVFLYAWYGGHWHRPFDKERVIRQMTRELGLSPAQVVQLTQIIDESSKKYAALHEQVRPQFDGVREQTDNQIRQILTREQVAKFNEMVERFRERMRTGRRP